MASALPEQVASRIDWSSLEQVKLNLVDPKLREVYSDITFTARLADHEVVLYVLLEHQSTQYALMPFRLLRYVSHGCPSLRVVRDSQVVQRRAKG